MQQVTHGAIQFTAYEELRKVLVNSRSEQSELISGSVDLLVSSSTESFQSYGTSVTH